MEEPVCVCQSKGEFGAFQDPFSLDLILRDNKCTLPFIWHSLQKAPGRSWQHMVLSPRQSTAPQAKEIARQQPDLVLSQCRLRWHRFCRPWPYSSFLITCRPMSHYLWEGLVKSYRDGSKGFGVTISVIVAPFRWVSEELIEIIVRIFRHSAHWCDSHARWPSNSEKTPGAWLTQTICHTTVGKNRHLSRVLYSIAQSGANA